jgi:hypothetical protein
MYRDQTTVILPAALTNPMVASGHLLALGALKMPVDIPIEKMDYGGGVNEETRLENQLIKRSTSPRWFSDSNMLTFH